MRVFLTGGSGYVGRHILEALLDKGYAVSALSRHPKADRADCDKLEWVVGNLDDPSSYAAALDRCDAVIHTALEYRDGAELSELDQEAVKVFLNSGKHLIYTGNLFSCPNDGERPISEAPFDGADAGWRNKAENRLLAHSTPCAIVRLGFVYGGSGSHLMSLLPSNSEGDLFQIVDPGGKWPMIHIEDVVALYMAVLDQKETGIFHAATEISTPVKTVIQLAALSQGKRIVPMTTADDEFPDADTRAFMARNISAENSASRRIGWQPSRNFTLD